MINGNQLVDMLLSIFYFRNFPENVQFRVQNKNLLAGKCNFK